MNKAYCEDRNTVKVDQKAGQFLKSSIHVQFITRDSMSVLKEDRFEKTDVCIIDLALVFFFSLVK